LRASKDARQGAWPVSFEARFSLAPQDDGGDIGARSVILRMRRDVTRSHRSFTMFGDARQSLREVAPNQPQSIRAKIRAWRNSRKFFYCQNSRLRVREAPVGTHLPASCDVDHAAIIAIANNENHCGRSVSCNLAKMTSISSADFPHQCASDFASLQLPFVACARLDASILP